MINVINATSDDITILANMNKQLIEDEQHDNPMDVNQLAERMSQFLRESYRAFLFYRDDMLLGYALVNMTQHPYYIRQFFISRNHRGQGVGKACFAHLKQYLEVSELDVEVLTHNEQALRFWQSVGFKPRSIYMTLRQTDTVTHK